MTDTEQSGTPLSPAEVALAERHHTVAGLSEEQNLILQLCVCIERLGIFLTPDKCAYRRDYPQIAAALNDARDCHNRALEIGVYKK